MKAQPISNENSYINAISSSNCVLDDTHMRACVWNHPFTRTFKYLEPPHPQQDSGGHARGGNVFFFLQFGLDFSPKRDQNRELGYFGNKQSHTHETHGIKVAVRVNCLPLVEVKWFPQESFPAVG